jgi:uncharacterized glyoxalase superfamily protein PhnB
MKFEKLTPMLSTWDLQGSLDFYTAVLGFQCDRFSAEWGWACLSRDGVELMLSRPNVHLDEAAAAFTGSLYIRVDDVDGLWKQLGDRARVCYPIETFDYGMREFAVYDNNGYLLQFGMAVDSKASDA